MKTVCMIPVKLRSERVPDKNIRSLGGRPLMHYIQRVCLETQALDAVYVYCSSDEVAPYVLDGVTLLIRPAWLDGDECNCNDLLWEFMGQVDADIYVASHATAPFTRPASIEACIAQVESGAYDSAFLAHPLRQMMWQNGQPLNFDPQHFPRTQDLAPIHVEASGAFVVARSTFEKYGRRVGEQVYIHEVDAIEAFDIDWPQDFAIAEAILQAMPERS